MYAVQRRKTRILSLSRKKIRDNNLLNQLISRNFFKCTFLFYRSIVEIRKVRKLQMFHENFLQDSTAWSL